MARRTYTTGWKVGGENATAECAQIDECDWEEMGYYTIKEAQLLAEKHARDTGHTVMVERAQFRYVNAYGEA